MYLVRGLENISSYRRRFFDRQCAATMGNFDGLHLGHRRILQRLQDISSHGDMRTLVVFFEPHPQEFFAPEQAACRLMSWREKVETIRHLGMDTAVMLRFDRRIQQLRPDEFISRVLEPLAPAFLVVGDDTRFGVDRSGGFEDLRKWGAGKGVSVESTPTLLQGGERVSSTRIRRALSDGDLELATSLLGRPWSYSGRVIRGRRKGRELGFPTANLRLPAQRLAISGVYAVRVHLPANEVYDGVVNMGVRPTFADPKQSLEAHLLDFDGDLYGHRIRLEFIAKLREERAFDGPDALKRQIARDVQSARTILQ